LILISALKSVTKVTLSVMLKMFTSVFVLCGCVGHSSDHEHLHNQESKIKIKFSEQLKVSNIRKIIHRIHLCVLCTT
jgi:hypothetical protein